MNCSLIGSSCSGAAKEAKWGVTAKGNGELFSFWISYLSSALNEAVSTAGSSSTEVMRDMPSVFGGVSKVSSKFLSICALSNPLG